MVESRVPADLWRNTVAAFVLTAVWDVILRLISTGQLSVPVVREWKWVRVLRDYFEAHTPLAAALIAGVCGAVAYLLIAVLWHNAVARVVKGVPRIGQEFAYVVHAALVSALVGIPMRYSELFPHLVDHYYRPLGFWYSFGTDAFSGIVVLLSMYALSPFVGTTTRSRGVGRGPP